MKRVTLILIAILTIGSSLAAGTASAAPPNRTTLTLSCDRGTRSATVDVTLQDTVEPTQTLGPFTLACGPESPSGLKRERHVEVQSAGFPVGYAAISSFDVTTATETVHCAMAGTLPLKFNCSDATRSGATMVVR